MAQDFDAHILATMTEEERASILEEQSPEEKAAIVAIDTGSENGPDDDDEDEDDEDDDEGAEPAIVAPAIAAPAPDKAQAPAEVIAVVPTAKEAEPLPELPEKAFQPHYQATLPDDFDAQEAAIKSQADALRTVQRLRMNVARLRYLPAQAGQRDVARHGSVAGTIGADGARGHAQRFPCTLER